jgi:hypothetical protein
MTPRCAVFAKWREAGTASPARAEPASRVAAVLAISLQVTLDEVASGAAIFAADPPPALVAQAPPKPPHAAPERKGPALPPHRDPLVADGSAYAHLSWPIVRRLRPLLQERGDQAGAEATEIIEETCATVASKIFRAVSGAVDWEDRQDDVQSDANGSAKVALLLIEESRQAWRVLMQPGRAIANGAPSRVVQLLDALERDVLTRFPHAFAFVRPGFDTTGGGGQGQMARAVRALAAARPN